MIHIKTDQEVKIMKKAGGILAEVLGKVLAEVKPGVSELELDALAEKLIRERGGEPGFMKVPGYKHTICVATNEVVVHGIPTEQKLKEGDVIGIDCGVFLDGFHSDMANTIKVQSVKRKAQKDVEDEVDRFLRIGEEAMWAGIHQVKAGNRVGHISQAIQQVIEPAGYSVVRDLIGHGVGRDLHEEPEIPGYLSKKIERTPLLKENMTIAVEVIYNMGKPEVTYANKDGWTISTADGNLSGVFERTVVVTKKGYEILTA